MIEKISFINLSIGMLGNLTNKIGNLIKYLPDGSYVSGGFVRDLYHKKQFKDLDIVCQRDVETIEFTKTAIRMALGNNITFEKYVKVDNENYNANSIHEVWKVIGAPVEIDIIVRKAFGLSPLDVISDFDLSINQGVLTYSKDYGLFAYYNTSKYVTINTKYPPNVKRIERLKDKFPNLIWIAVNKEVDKLKNPPKRDKNLKGHFNIEWGRAMIEPVPVRFEGVAHDEF